jgi:hypothetical protein
MTILQAFGQGVAGWNWNVAMLVPLPSVMPHKDSLGVTQPPARAAVTLVALMVTKVEEMKLARFLLPGIVLSTECTFSHWTLIMFLRGSNTLSSILYVRSLNVREVKQPSQDHTARKWGSQDGALCDSCLPNHSLL